MSNFSKYKKVLLSVLLVNILLVSTHLGEFWPFSIFPMFSKAGNPWSRGLVQQVDSVRDPGIWQTKSLDEVENHVVSLDSIGVDAIDYANFVSKTSEWTPQRIQALRDLLQIDSYPNAKWMATRVKGYLTEDDSVIVEAIPLFLVTVDSTYSNPNLFSN